MANDDEVFSPLCRYAIVAEKTKKKFFFVCFEIHSNSNKLLLNGELRVNNFGFWLNRDFIVSLTKKHFQLPLSFDFIPRTIEIDCNHGMLLLLTSNIPQTIDFVSITYKQT